MYYIKRMDCVSYGVYKSVVVKVVDDMEQAFDIAYELSCQTGVNHFVDFNI